VWVGLVDQYTIRTAVPADIDTLVAFTLREAREAEHRELDRELVTRGVRGGFDDPPHATYWVAETAKGEPVASTSNDRAIRVYHRRGLSDAPYVIMTKSL